MIVEPNIRELNYQVITVKLAAAFLKELTSRFANDGCEDWRWPDWVPQEYRHRLETLTRKGSPDAEIADRPVVQNTLVVYGLINHLAVIGGGAAPSQDPPGANSTSTAGW